MTARTITKTITVCKFSELSESAKQHVKDRHSELFGYSWSDDPTAPIERMRAAK